MTHSGGAFGHYTEFQLYPDIEFGVYLSINGIAGSQARALVIMYIGTKAWNSLITECTISYHLITENNVQCFD